MWKIIKSQFVYNKYLLEFLLLFSTLIFFLILLTGWESAEKDIPGISSLMTGISITLIAIFSVRSAKEKTERFITVLPVKKWQIGLARLIYLHSIWFIFLSVFILLFSIIRPDELQSSLVWYFLSLSGLITIFNCAPFLQRDLSSIFTVRYARTAIAASYVIIFISIYFIFIGTRAFSRYFDIPQFTWLSGHIHNIAPEPVNALFLLLVSVVLNFTCVVLYIKRKVYFD